MQTWGIIGTGWLGGALTSHLTNLKKNYWGTNRKSFNWEMDQFPKLSCDILFLNTPPLINTQPVEFVGKIPMNPTQKIIFISSIGVYGSLSGTITETSSPKPITKNAIWLSEVEKLLFLKFKEQITIIRAGGLIGDHRHPVISLSGRPHSIDDGPINLIHRTDLIEIVLEISRLNFTKPTVINAVAPYHPYKSDYYGIWCQKLNLRQIEFTSKCKGNKIVESEILPSIYPNWKYPKLDAV